MEYDLVVIGAGPGGYVAAIKAAQSGLKTLLVDKSPYLGGTCLNVGCIPSKALLQSTEHYYQALHEFAAHGIEFESLKFNFKKMQERKESVVSTFRSGLIQLMKKYQVTTLEGTASFASPTTLSISSHPTITFKQAIIATGSTPLELPFLPFDEKLVLSSTGTLSLSSPPKTLGVIGAGVIGVELGSVFARLGTKVTVLEFFDRVTPTLDKDISKAFQKELELQGLTFKLQAKVIKGAHSTDHITLTYEHEGKTQEEAFEKVLVATGRKPVTSSLNLSHIGITVDSKGFIPVNKTYQTTQPHIYAIGDVIGQPMLAHKASDEGIAVVEHLLNRHSHVQMMAIPSVVYTDPEVATVGLTEEEAKELKLPYKAFKFPMKANSRAKAALQDHGFVKLIAHEKGYLLGAHLICSHAGELIQPLIVLLDQKIPLSAYVHIPHAHPTLVEALKEAALGIVSSPIHL
jgi:dihydrolipoamide dehydrogenase